MLASPPKPTVLSSNDTLELLTFDTPMSTAIWSKNDSVFSLRNISLANIRIVEPPNLIVLLLKRNKNLSIKPESRCFLFYTLV